MTAVFIENDNQYIDLTFFPKEKFIRIKTTEDIRGRKYNSFILGYSWWKNEKMLQALKLLKELQPELFKNTNFEFNF